MILRLSRRLSTKIKVGALPAAPLDDDPYADWSARLFTAERTRSILLSHTSSLYSVVMFGRGITHDRLLIGRASDSLREFMDYDGLELMYLNFIAPTTASVRFHKALNRSVTGSMNQLEERAKSYLESEWSPMDVGFKLNEMLLSSIGTRDTGGYGTPRDALRRLGT
jgi:hypothetical protein